MRTPVVLAGLLAGLLGGCAAPRSPTLDYLPPSGPPAAARSAVVRQQPWLVWGSILDHLQQQGLSISEVDEPAGELVVRYRGDPEPYVDCGWIVAYQEGRAVERTPAATDTATFRRRWDGKLVTVERDLELDARMVILVEPDGPVGVVRTESIYGLTKSVAPQTAAQPLHTETISFRSGGSASFSSGTTCQPTGALERVVLDALPAMSFAGS